MAATRESALLPTIKCSSCGNQVAIMEMGDHVCAGPTAELSPPPEADDNFNSYSYNQPKPEKQGRTPPALDTRAANGPFLRQGQLTPNSIASEPRSGSPFTPNAPHNLGRPDDYFGLQTGNNGPPASSPRTIDHPGGYRSFSGHDAAGTESTSMSASPTTLSSSNFMKRMNSIAPGPFDAPKKRSPASRAAFPPRQSSLGKKEDFQQMLNPSSTDSHAEDRPGTALSTASTNSNSNSNSNMPPPSIPRKSAYEGFGPPIKTPDDLEPQPLGLINRSETFPKASLPAEAPLRTPSAPGARPDRPDRMRTQSGDDVRRPSMMGPDTSRPPPPRKSLIRPQTGKFAGSVDLMAEFGAGNPYHTPSDSGSSGYSTFSHPPSHSSSQTSPASSQPRRQPSSDANIDELMNDLHSSMEKLRPTKDLRIDLPPPPSRTRSPLAESPYQISPREERHDPAIQSARPADLSPRKLEQTLPSTQYGTSPQSQHAFDPAAQSVRREGSTPKPVGPPSRKGSRDPTAPRGDCKACKLPIKGKSISSADGRLTGKYHKACFVCATCHEPFTSAEFYVLNDKPYCEQHYHKLNGSLCGSCGRGIEGQYLEDEFTIKYHVGCFRCLDCGRSLSDGYFEVDGKSYCERDAWRRVQQPWLAGKGMSPESDSSLQPPPRSNGRPSKNGLPSRPGQSPRGNGLGMGFPRPPYGLPSGNRLVPPTAGSGPRMNKRNTRLGMM